MPITLQVRDRVAEVVFDHPPVNAFDTTRWELIPKLLAEAGSNEGVRCVLIRAERPVGHCVCESSNRVSPSPIGERVLRLTSEREMIDGEETLSGPEFREKIEREFAVPVEKLEPMRCRVDVRQKHTVQAELAPEDLVTIG